MRAWSWSFVAGVALLVAVAAAGCGDGADKGGTAAAPPLGAGKADVADRVSLRGALAFAADGAAAGELAEDLAFDGWTLAVRAGATLTLDVTRTGSSSKLDTTLYVYGPQGADGGYGTEALAFDDDSGWGRLSRLRALTLAEGGTYLVVVGSFDGRGRGRYRLEARCESGECAPAAPPVAEGACHPAVAAAIEACVADWRADPDFDPSVTTDLDLLEGCADAEIVAPAWDALCTTADAPAALCQVDFETFATTHVPLCRRELYGRLLDGSCVFGQRYGDVFGSAAEAVVVVWGRVLTADSPLSALEQEQVLLAVRTTAYDDVATVAEAFAAVDGGEVNQHELWDASARRAFTVYELGAGDNSFGAFFAHGTTTLAARINDGDLLDCAATWGPERRRCAADDECTAGLRCTGRPEGVPFGRCIDPTRDDHPAIGSECQGAAGCPAGAGLVCAGAPLDGAGLCLPAWMRGRYGVEPAQEIPDGDPAGAEVQLLVWGLATVDMDVSLDLVVSHPRVADLRVTLTNPAGTEAVVFDGAPDGPELYLRDAPVRGFSGDESVNGVWRLKVVDGRGGQTGAIGRFGLTVTSRWD